MYGPFLNPPQLYFFIKVLDIIILFVYESHLNQRESKAKDRMNIIFQYAINIVKDTGIRVNSLWKTHKVERMKLPGLIMF